MANMMMNNEVITPLQNGDYSENGASVQPDVSGNILEDRHPATSIVVEMISEKDVFSTEDTVNESRIGPSSTPFEEGDAALKSTHVEEVRGFIDTAAPFESVKEAVSKFGGIVDWKAHKLQSVERLKFVAQGLEKMREDLPQYKKTSEIAEAEKLYVLKGLKLNLGRSQKEEQQAKHDSELAILRVEAMEQGIADESSVAAIAELKLVKDVSDKLRMDYDALVEETDLAVNKSEEALSALKEVEKTVEELTIEMIAAKESLESSQVAHVEAEEYRIGVAMAKEQESLTWEKELKRAEEELKDLKSQVQTAKDLKSNLKSASALLIELKGELAVYMDSKLKQDETSTGDGTTEESTQRTYDDLQLAIESSRKELVDAKLDIEKATAKIDYLKVAAASLQLELENEKSSLVATRQREGVAAITAAALESDLKSIQSEIDLAQTREEEAKDNMTVLPKQLQKAAQEADESKSLARLAREELRKVEEEVEQVRAAASTVERLLLAAQKEIEAAKTLENLALAAVEALQETQSTGSINDAYSSSYVTISLEEYYELSKHAHEAEEQANVKVSTAFSQVEAAKLSESRNLATLEQLNKEIATRKDALENAKEKAEESKEGKLGVEDELRKLKARESSQTPRHPNRSQAKSFDESRAFETDIANYCVIGNPYVQESYRESESSTDVKVLKTKKGKQLFPRIFKFLSERRAEGSFRSR